MVARRHLLAPSLVALTGLALLAWALAWPSLGAVDAWWRWAPPTERSISGQVWSAIALITSPALLYPLAGLAAFWAARRRLLAVSATIVLTVVLTYSFTTVVKTLLLRPRMDSPWAYLLSQHGWSFPSGHVSAWTAIAIAMVTLARVAGARASMLWMCRGMALASVTVVALCRLVLHAHYVTDVIGGALVGLFTASLSNLLCDVHSIGKRHRRRGGRVAVILNPVKIVDMTLFRQLLESALKRHGWASAIYLPTTADDPGRAMARQAVAQQADLVLIAGGDGTVRVALGALAGSGITAAIIPSGTANLLAQNLGIPFDVSRALTLALHGEVKPLDLIRTTSPEHPELVEYAAVLAGIGADAAVISTTDEDLKRQIGTAAYVVAALNQIKTHPMKVRVTIDDGEPVDRDASLVSIGNVGDLQPGLTLLPGASASDGLLDVLVASPRHIGDLVEMIGGVLIQAKNEPRIDRFTGRSVRLETTSPALCQIDGDVIGEFRRLDFEIVPAAVQLARP